MWWKAERALVISSWLILAKRVLTNITPVAKGYHGWILTWCEVYFTKWHRHLCETSHPQLLWIISLQVQCWLVWLHLSIAFCYWGPSIISALQLKIRWTGCSRYSFVSEPPRPAASLCHYYLFSTWLTCNLNSLNSNDNRLLCMGSHCIRGQGETDSLFVLFQWSLGLGLIRGAKAYTAPNQLQPGQLNLSQTY